MASTGYEISEDGRHALIRSVAVRPSHRSRGRGAELARFALERARDEGADRAWLFSRRSGPFWQGLDFSPADRDELADVLAHSAQVRLFRETGQLDQEIAWSRPLTTGRPQRRTVPTMRSAHTGAPASSGTVVEVKWSGAECRTSGGSSWSARSTST